VLENLFVPPQSYCHFAGKKQSQKSGKKAKDKQRSSSQLQSAGDVHEVRGKMSDMNEFVDVFKPASPEFRISVVHENHADSDSQEQQRQGAQLFHKLHFDPPQSTKNPRQL
jgi:hypothetical protein